MPRSLLTSLLATLTPIGFLALLALSPPSAVAGSPPKLDEAPVLGMKASGDAAVIIGNQAYADLPDALHAGADANAFLSYLMKSRGVSASRIRVVSGANRNEARAAIRKVAGKVKKGATLWFFFAGQATASPEGDRYLLADDTEASENGLSVGGLSLDDIVQVFAGTRAGHIVLVIDAGFGSLGRDGEPLIPTRGPMPWGPKWTTDPRVIVWSATQGNEYAGTWRGAGHGLFTALSLGAARGWADGALGDNPDGKVTLGEANAYVSEAMGLLGYSQVPTFDGSPKGRAFVLAEGKTEQGPSIEDFRQWGQAEILTRVQERSERMKADAAVAWKKLQPALQTGGPAAQNALEQYLLRYERPVVSLSVSTPGADALEARRMLERLLTTGKLDSPNAGSAIARLPAEQAAPPVAPVNPASRPPSAVAAGAAAVPAGPASTSAAVPATKPAPAAPSASPGKEATTPKAPVVTPPESKSAPPVAVIPPETKSVPPVAVTPPETKSAPPVAVTPPETKSAPPVAVAPLVVATPPPVSSSAGSASSPAATAPPTPGSTTPVAAIAPASGESKAGSPSAGKASTPPAATTGSPSSKPDTCDDLFMMEQVAVGGKLSPGQIACLEARIAKEKLITGKDKVSRLLLVDAEARGDQERWQRTAERHFETIGRSDPDLCFKYAVFQAKNGKDQRQVVLWADYALENKDRWVGKQYEKRVYSLLRLKAEAANFLWSEAEDTYIAARNEMNEQSAKEARGLAKEYSKAWLDYARISAQDPKKAEALCLAASGTSAFCSEE